MNDRNDFLPEVRNSAWWSSDTRKAVNGKAISVVLTKQGKLPIYDLSGVEAVQMGHVMQPVIASLAQDRLKMSLKDADYSLTHAKESWLKSHFDYISEDGQTLVEVKNYNASVRNKFDPETNRVPVADYAQCVHECTVHNLSHIFLAVLFGGQELQIFEFHISDAEKEQLIQEMAVYWSHVTLGTTPNPQTVEETKLAYPVSNDSLVIATKDMELAIAKLKAAKESIKELEEFADQYETMIRNAIGDSSELRTFDGQTLATWKSSKPSKRFSADLFKSAMPDIYEQFVIEQPGARRFLIK